MSEKVVILPSFLRDIFMAYRILQWQVVVGFFFFSFSTLKYFSNVFLLTLFPTGNSVLNVPFSCVGFQTSFLLLSLENCNQMCWYNFFFLCLGFVEFLDLWVFITFAKFENCWVAISSGFFLFYPLSSFMDFNYIYWYIGLLKSSHILLMTTFFFFYSFSVLRFI